MRKYSFFLCALLLAGCGDNSNLYLGDGIGKATPKLNPPPAVVPGEPTGDSPEGYEGVVEANFRQHQRTDKVDITFSIDNSGSMSGHIQNVARNIAKFSDYLLHEKIDFQMGIVISSEMKDGRVHANLVGPHPIVSSRDGDVPGRVQSNLNFVLDQHVGGYEIGVSILEDAITFPVNRLLYREDAAKAFVVLTDVGDNLHKVKDVPHFLQVFDRFAGEFPWTMIGIGLPAGAPNCGVEGDDHSLLEMLVNLSGGSMGNICDEDYGPILTKAAERVTSLLRKFSLARYPELAYAEITKIQVFVDEQEIPADPQRGYVWEATEQAISFPGIYAPPAGSKIRVRIEYKVVGQ